MKPFGGVDTVLGDLGRSGVEDRLHEGVAVVPEVGALGGEAFEDLEVADEALVNQ